MTSQPASTDAVPNGSDLTLEEMAESLTGFEEIAVEKHFDHDIGYLLEHRSTLGVRALIFTERVRAGATAPAAKEFALNTTMKAATEWYADEAFEPDPDDPETDQGKGGQPPAGEPTNSPAGA